VYTSLNIKCIVAIFSIFFLGDPGYKYILICTSKNCTPCIKTAAQFFEEKKITYQIINLYENIAEKKFTEDAIVNYCKGSKYKVRNVKNTYSFGERTFTEKDNGPFLIKYSKTDTVIFNSLNIDSINE
jgi:arsenate reductase-like glutaredoxin family protein